MKHFRSSILIFLALFVLTKTTLFFKKSQPLNTSFLQKPDLTFEKRFTFALFAIDEKTFLQTLSSVLGQNYDNYRALIFLKDSQEQKNFKTLCQRYNKEHLVEFIPIKKETDFINSYKNCINKCQDDEIIVQLSGDDWLSHPNVLKALNTIYTSSESIWLTYPEALLYPSYKKISKKAYLKKWLFKPKHDKIPYLASQLKTYYAGLAKQIATKKDFRPRHKTLENNLDLYLLPMIEAAKEHIHYIEEVLYIHKSTT
jgi:hypothetical protein